MLGLSKNFLSRLGSGSTPWSFWYLYYLSTMPASKVISKKHPVSNVLTPTLVSVNANKLHSEIRLVDGVQYSKIMRNCAVSPAVMLSLLRLVTLIQTHFNFGQSPLFGHFGHINFGKLRFCYTHYDVDIKISDCSPCPKCPKFKCVRTKVIYCNWDPWNCAV